MPRVIEVDGLFDGKRTTQNAAIVIDDARVVWVGRRGRVPAAYAGAQDVEAPARFLLPGLIDCHTHLTLSGGLDLAADVQLPPATQALRALANAQLDLRSGATTVRDLGAAGTMVIELARAAAAGTLVAPRILAAGRGITTTGGHGFEVGRCADGPDEVRRAVREQVRDGASAIKLFATGGVLGGGASPDVAQFSVDEARAAVQEARRAGLRITAHAHAAEGVRVAIEAGVDSIEHGTLLDVRTVRLLEERDVALVPTMSPVAAMLPHLDELPELVRDRARAVAPRHQESVQMAHRSGVRIAAGTDAGGPFNTHGRLWNELRLLHEAGLSNEEALAAATSTAAKVVGVPHAGRIAAGSHADLVFVDRDPTADLAALRAPRAVWLAGVEVFRAALS